MDDKRPYLAAILIQSIYAGMFLLSKAAFDVGMNNFVFVFYRQLVGTLFLVPLAFFFEWKNAPSISLITFLKIFMLAFIGITLSMDINCLALVYTSPTLASATSNSIPVITFFFAVLFGMEVLKIVTKTGIAKVIGIITCIGGVAILALYKGPQFKLIHTRHILGHHHHTHKHNSTKKWIFGCFLMLCSNILWSLWLVLQVGVLKNYPSKLVFTTIQCFCSAIQTFVIAISVERDFSQWKLGWDIRLLSIIYCGIVVTGVTYYLQSWVIEKRGPVFLSMTQPLLLVITTCFSAFIFGEKISLGSILGGLLLIGGLYSVLWAKNREIIKKESTTNEVDVVSSISNEVSVMPTPPRSSSV